MARKRRIEVSYIEKPTLKGKNRLKREDYKLIKTCSFTMTTEIGRCFRIEPYGGVLGHVIGLHPHAV